MNDNACNPFKLVYPAKQLLKVSSIPTEELHHPEQLDKENKKCIFILKKGISSTTTISFMNGLFP